MTKTKLLTPILTIGTLGAVVTPMTILTSCNKSKNTGKDANLVNDYDCELEALEKKTYKNTTEALTAYLNCVDPQTNDEAYIVLKDDARYSYSLGLKTENFKEWIGGSYTSYTMDFDKVQIVNTDSAKTMDVTFKIKVNGGFDDSEIKVEDANLDCTFKMAKPFDLTFHKPDDLTLEKRNYITCATQSYDATYTISGSFKLNGVQKTLTNKSGSCDISDYNPTTDEAKIAYMVKQFVLTGLSCNFKDPSSYAAMGGVLYTNYFANAEITA